MCFLIFHKWSSWELYKYGKIRLDGEITGDYITQVSYCSKCGKARFRTIET